MSLKKPLKEKFNKTLSIFSPKTLNQLLQNSQNTQSFKNIRNNSKKALMILPKKSQNSFITPLAEQRQNKSRKIPSIFLRNTYVSIIQNNSEISPKKNFARFLQIQNSILVITHPRSTLRPQPDPKFYTGPGIQIYDLIQIQKDINR